MVRMAPCLRRNHIFDHLTKTNSLWKRKPEIRNYIFVNKNVQHYNFLKDALGTMVYRADSESCWQKHLRHSDSVFNCSVNSDMSQVI